MCLLSINNNVWTEQEHPKKQQCMDRAGNILKNNNVWTEQETS